MDETPNMKADLSLKSQINDWLFEATKGVVQSGPFEGIKLLPKEGWEDGNLGVMLLGCYEKELHDPIEKEIKRLSGVHRAQVVDVGCAEGYYAIGMKKRLPFADVWALDISETAMQVCEENAALNEVELLTSESIDRAFKKPDLVIMDVEAAELFYLDLEKYPALKNATIIVECHDYDLSGEISGPMIQRFLPTHDILCMREGARDPNEFTMLHRFHSDTRWIAVSEGRPCMMHWLYMRPIDGQ